MPWGHQKKEEDSDRLVLCEVDASSGGEANELAHLLFKLSQISKRLEHHDCSLHQHIANKIQKTKADIIETFVNGTPTSKFVAKVVRRVRSVQRDVERLENNHESSCEKSSHDFLSYVVHKINNDNYPLKVNKRPSTTTQKPSQLKTQTWDRTYKTKKAKTTSSTSFKPKSKRKNMHSEGKVIARANSGIELHENPSESKGMEPAWENKTAKREVYEPKAGNVPVPNVSNDKTYQTCKCCYLEKFQKDQADMKRCKKLQYNVKRNKNTSSRCKETTNICTTCPSGTSIASCNKAWTQLDPRFSYKVLKRCTGCPVHNKPRELKKDPSCIYEQKNDSLYHSAKAFAKSVAGRGAALLSPLHQKKKCVPIICKNETILLPSSPSDGHKSKRIASKDKSSEKLEKPVSKSTVTPKLRSVDRATSYEKFYINPVGLPNDNFRPVLNTLINEEWRYFGDDYPLKLDKIEEFRGEGVEYTIMRPAEIKTKIDSGTQTDSQAIPLEYKVANMNIVYSKTHLKYIVPDWKESSAETVSTPKILCKKELDDGLAVTTYKMDPDGTIYFTLAYSTDTANEEELDVHHSEDHKSTLKSVKDVWIQSARHLYNSLKETYSGNSSRDSSH